MGSAEGFAVLGGSTVTNTGATVITGNLGVRPGGAITGFLPGVAVSGTIHAADAVAAQAQSDVAVAYNDLAGRASDVDLTGQDLGGLTLSPGVYTFATSAQLTGTLTLDAQGDPNAEFVFQIGSTITTASNSFVVMINGGDSCKVFWQVGSSATSWHGHVLRGEYSRTHEHHAHHQCVDYERQGLGGERGVTMDTNQVSVDGCGSISWEKRATDGNPVLLPARRSRSVPTR